MALKSKRTAALVLFVAAAACKSPVAEPPPPPAPPATKAQLVQTLVQLSNMKPLRPASAAALLGVRLGTEQTSGHAVSEWSMEPGPLVAGGTALRNGPYVDITFRPRPGLGLTFEDVAAQFLDVPFKIDVPQHIPHNLQAMVDDAGRAPRKFRVPAGELRVFLGTGPPPWNGRVQSITVTDDIHPEWGGTETLREKRARQQPPHEPDDEAVSATDVDPRPRGEPANVD